MVMFKKPGSALARLSTATPPAGGNQFITSGDFYGGGFFLATIEDGGRRYALIVSPAASGENISIQWKTTDTATAGTSSRTNGWANTIAMNDAAHPAASWCRGLTINGFTDWYLPAIDELAAIYAARGSLTGSDVFAADDYWSSTERSDAPTQALMWRFATGVESNQAKSVVHNVRAIRRVAI